MELQAEHLCKSYGKKEALRDVNFKLEQGVYGLLGENGAGKSTLMRILTTVDFPSGGSVFCGGKNIFQMDEYYRGLIGYMPQDYSVYPGFTATDFLNYMGTLKGIPADRLKAKIPEVLEFVNLSDVANKKVRTFSGGMKRRIGIAQAILNDPEILILDEPTAGLDPKERIRFSNILSNMAKEKIILLSTHIVSDIEAIANQLIMINRGEITETGNVDDLVQRVAGKVWEATVTQDMMNYVNAERAVIHIKQAGKGIQVRFVGEPFSDTLCKPVIPTLEDYYIYVNENKKE
ncbi:MAG: ABC transporter ATP-binding protein [Lachnospiraceae bacterium]|nr:ABC transporter ATP-binding protein [Lachnospiraceae bacterium]